MLNANVVIGILNQLVRTATLKASTISEAFSEMSLDQASPTLAILNGKPILRKDWNTVVPDGSKLDFVLLSANLNKADKRTLSTMLPPVAAVYFIGEYTIRPLANLLVGRNFASIDTTPVVTDEQKADAVYSFAGKRNSNNLNNPIETAYGKNRWYPSYVCLPYVEYRNNTAILKAWLSLGHGDFDIEDVKVGESSVNDLPGCFWQYFSANLLYSSRQVSFDDYTADVVIPADDISGTELKAPNQEGYQEIVIENLTAETDEIDTVLINLVFPSGCYATDVAGGIYAKTVTVRTWLTKETGTGRGVEHIDLHDLTFASKTPQRISLKIPAGYGVGRWSCKIARLTDSTEGTEEGSNSQDVVNIESITGLKASTTTYKTSGIYINLEASATVDSDAASKLNVIATRKLLVYDGIGWESVATRSPIWALIDILQSQYGASQPDERIDFDYFLSLDKNISTNFDFVFNQKTTVHEACRTVANSFRGELFPVGSDYRVSIPSRDDLPVAVFGPDNSEDVTWTMFTKKQLDCDCIDVSYVDPVTGTEASVRFTPPGSFGINPRSIKALGCTDRTWAWKQGAYSYLTETLGRDSVSFTTAETGMLPTVGDLVALSWPFPAWGIGGEVVSYAANVLTVSELLPTPAGQAWVLLQAPEGRAWGPYPCTRTGDYQITLGTEPSPDIDFSGLGKNPVLFSFGGSTEIAKWFRVSSIDYGTGGAKISGALFDPNVFKYDDMEAPANDRIPVVVPSTYLTGIEVEFYDAGRMRVTWKPVGNATDYRVRYTWNPSIGSDPTDLLRRQALSAYSLYITGGGSYTTAEVINNSAMLLRSVGDLFVQITPYVDGAWDTTNEGVWRGQFTATVGRASVLILGNSGVNAQASLSYADTGSVRTQEKQYLDFYSDVPVGFDATLRLTPKDSLGFIITEYAVIERTINSKGSVTLTSDELEKEGWLSAYPGETPIQYIECELENTDGTTINFNVSFEALNWTVDYAADSLSVATAAHGYYDLTNYPQYLGRIHSDIRLNAYYDYIVRLKQPGKYADRTQTWWCLPNPVSEYGKPALVSKNKRMHHYINGYLNSLMFIDATTPEGFLLVTLTGVSNWSAYEEKFTFSSIDARNTWAAANIESLVVGVTRAWAPMADGVLVENKFVGPGANKWAPVYIEDNLPPITPETLIKTYGAIVLACLKDDSQPRNESFVQIDRSVHSTAFLFMQYKSDTDQWYIKKCANTSTTFNPSDVVPLTSQEITDLGSAYLVLPEWPLPRGFVFGNINCNRRALFNGGGPTLTAAFQISPPAT